MKAEKGDLIRILPESDAVLYGWAESGEICEVHHVVDDYGEVIASSRTDSNVPVEPGEYVIHRKAGEEDEAPAVVDGVGPDAPVVINELGAKQSHSPYRMDLIDAKALLKIAQVHKQGGDKYGDTNWRGIPVNDHINHALVHVYAHLAGDTSDEHLAHAATRLIFSLALELDAKST